MDKEYLIHNIDSKDNPEDQHQTIDITISDLEVDQDITATIGIDTYVNGILTSSNKYEDVSLTGAGGGDATIELIGIIAAPVGYFDVCYADDIQYILDEDEERVTVVRVTGSEPVTITVPIGGAIYPMIDGSTTVETTGGFVEKTVDPGITYFEVTGDGSITMTQDL